MDLQFEDSQFVDRFRTFIKLETAEDIEKWRQERRKNFPRFGVEKKPVSNVPNFASNERREKQKRNNSHNRRGRRANGPYFNRQKSSLSHSENNVSTNAFSQHQFSPVQHSSFQQFHEVSVEKTLLDNLIVTNHALPVVKCEAPVTTDVNSSNVCTTSEVNKACQPIGALKNIFSAYASSESEDETTDAPQSTNCSIECNTNLIAQCSTSIEQSISHLKEVSSSQEAPFASEENNNKISNENVLEKKPENTRKPVKTKKFVNTPRPRKLTLFERLMQMQNDSQDDMAPAV